MLWTVLDQAVRTFRRIVRATHPLVAEVPIDVGGDPAAEAPFDACTDGRTIRLRLNHPDDLWADLGRLAATHYQGAAEVYGTAPVDDGELHLNLALDALLFVLFHELYHPLVCPLGPDDEAAVSRAILAGIRQREPDLGAKDAVLKVDRCKNLLWDVVVNVTFLARSEGVRRHPLRGRVASVFRAEGRAVGGRAVTALPSEVVPALYLVSCLNGRTDALISLAGMLYVTLSVRDVGLRKRAMQTFLDGSGLAEDVARDLLRGLYRSLAAGTDRNELRARAELVTDLENPAYGENRTWLLRALDAIFDARELRYDAIRRLAAHIAPLVPVDRKAGSLDPTTTGAATEQAPAEPTAEEAAAGSLARTLGDLAGELGDEVTQGVLRDLAGESGDPGLRAFAQDELYRRTATPVEILAPRSGLDLVDLGRQLRWEHRRTETLNAADVGRLDLASIVQAQAATGLPILARASEGPPEVYLLSEFILAESPIRGWAPKTHVLDVPEHWVLLLDSSGSMDAASWDLLLRATYGIQKGLVDVCTAQGRDVRIGIVNFSDATEWSGLASLRDVWATRTHPSKRILFERQGGGTRLDPAVFARIRAELGPGRVAYTLVTDGEIANDSEVYGEIERIASEPRAAFLFVEIGARSELGNRLGALALARPNVVHRSLGSVAGLSESLSSVLLRYGPRP